MAALASCPITSCLSMVLSVGEDFCQTCLLFGKKIVDELLDPSQAPSLLLAFFSCVQFPCNALTSNRGKQQSSDRRAGEAQGEQLSGGKTGKSRGSRGAQH